jgi:glycosyltransferase involved in cell wall biosynthesis
VVATAVGGVPSVIRNRDTGLLVPPGEPAALAQAIKDMLGDSDRAAEMGEHGRRLVEESFGLEPMIRSFEAIYTEVLDG